MNVTTATKNLAVAVNGAGKAANKMAHRDDELILAIMDEVPGHKAGQVAYLDAHASLTVKEGGKLVPVPSPYTDKALAQRWSKFARLVSTLGHDVASVIVASETTTPGEFVTLDAIYRAEAKHRAGVKAVESVTPDTEDDDETPNTTAPDVDKLLAGLMRAAEKLSDAVRADTSVVLSDAQLAQLNAVNTAMVNATRISAGRKVVA